MKKKRSFWPYIIAGFLAVVFLVNFTMLALAIKSDDGLTDPDYYEKGLFYTERLQAEKRLGWTMSFSFVDKPRAASPNRARVELAGGGAAVDGATVKIVLKRPATSRFDAGFEMKHTGNAYAGEILIPSGGLWDIDVVAEKDGRTMERVFRIKI